MKVSDVVSEVQAIVAAGDSGGPETMVRVLNAFGQMTATSGASKAANDRLREELGAMRTQLIAKENTAYNADKRVNAMWRSVHDADVIIRLVDGWIPLLEDRLPADRAQELEVARAAIARLGKVTPPKEGT